MQRISGGRLLRYHGLMTERNLMELLNSTGLELVKTDEGLALTDGTLTVRGDFARMLPRLRPANLNRELLVKAARLKHADGPIAAVDATAGLGDDSLLLAAAGFDVTMFERNPVIAALLDDALERASHIPELVEIANRMKLVEGDSTSMLAQLETGPDIVLLDPMFPAKRKDSAAKKKLQLLQRLEMPCDDEAALLDAARTTGASKVVVKRPIKGPYLAGAKPSYSLSGKAIRYDCYV